MKINGWVCAICLTTLGASAARAQQDFNLAAWSAPGWGCNSVRFVQVPGKDSGWTDYFLGRVMQSDGSCDGIDWSLGIGTMDWNDYSIHFKNYILQPPFTTSDGYEITSSYDPSVVYYNGEYWVAWECYGSIPGGVADCMGPLDLDSGKIDVSRTYIAVLGISFNNDGLNYSASVPKLMTHQGNIYLYWDCLQIDPATGIWNWATTRGTPLEQESGGLRRLWPKGVGGSIASNAPADASRLVMQTDGNLVLYDSNDTAVWATNWMQQYSQGAMAGQPTQQMNCPNCYAALQWDGNLVLYNPDFGEGAAGAYWASNTAGNPGARFEVFEDGISIVNGSGGTLWSSESGAGGTGPYVFNSASHTDFFLHAGQSVASDAHEVWGLGTDDRSNTLVDTDQFISDGKNVYSLGELGGSGGTSPGAPGTPYCTNPIDTSPGCYRMAVARADAPIGDDAFNEAILPDGILPSNPMNYPVLIFPPDGSVRFLGEFFAPPDSQQDAQTIPAGNWTFPIPCQAAAFFAGFGANCAKAYQVAASENWTLRAGQIQKIGELTVTMQVDGNLVIYSGGAAVWATSWMSTFSTGGMAGRSTQQMTCPNCYAVFQSDGNLVLYNPDLGQGSGAAYWASNTNGNPDAQLQIFQTSPYIDIGGSGSIFWLGS